MRRAAIVAAALGLACAGAAPAWATWSDTTAVSGATVGSGALAAVPVQCEEQTLPILIDAARVYWTPSTWPTTLTYTAQIVQSGQSLTVDGNSSTTIRPSLLGAGLFGQTITIRVTGTLPGTSWTAFTDRSVYVGLLGAYVDCTGP